MRKTIIILIILVSANLTYSQSIKIGHYNPLHIWQVVEYTLINQKIDIQRAYPKDSTLITGFVQYSRLMIKNRVKLKFKLKVDTLFVEIIQREYISENRWVENLLPMTKKSRIKLLQPIIDKIDEVTGDQEQLNKAIKDTRYFQAETKRLQEIEDLKKVPYLNGQYAIFRTTEPQFDIISFHEDGTVISFKLNYEMNMPKLMVIKESVDSEPFVLEFDENGLPLMSTFKDYHFVYGNYRNDSMDMMIVDPEGAREMVKGVQNDLIPGLYRDPEFNPDANGPHIFKMEEGELSLSELLELYGIGAGIASCAITVASGGSTAMVTGGPCLSTMITLLQKAIPKQYVQSHKELAAIKFIVDMASVCQPTGMLLSFISDFQTTIDATKIIVDAYNNYDTKKLRNALMAECLTEIYNEPAKGIIKSEANINPVDWKSMFEVIEEGRAKIESKEEKISDLNGKSTQEGWEEISKQIEVVKEEIAAIKEQYELRLDKFIKEKNFTLGHFKSDGESAYGIKGIKITGMRWTKYESFPSLMIGIQFNANTKTLKTNFSGTVTTHKLHLSYLGCDLQDAGKNNLTSYGLLISETIINEGVVVTSIPFKYMKDISRLEFTTSKFRKIYN